MGEELIIQATELMQEQTEAYQRLNLTCAQLIEVLTQSNAETVGSLVKTGESELLNMRARLLRLMFTLTSFADARAAMPAEHKIGATTRDAFSRASTELQKAAISFQKTCGRASVLATNGAIFASVCIEMFGILPTTYRGPYIRRGEGRAWV